MGLDTQIWSGFVSKIGNAEKRGGQIENILKWKELAMRNRETHFSSVEASNPTNILLSFYCIIVKIKYIHILLKQDVPSITHKFRTFTMFVLVIT